jgi:Domain of unknown function (DUF4337)
MSHGTEHHLEEAHHAEHASHDDFNKRVAMTMAIIAACLAFVTLLSHRAHNQTLQYQLKANIKRTEASDRWAQYQAKNIRKNEYEALSEMLAVLPVKPGQETACEELREQFTKQVKRYTTTSREEEKNRNDPKELPGLEELARDLDKESRELDEMSEHYHQRADRFDLGELGIELALVVCSVSVLTRKSLFWLSGTAIGVVGFLIALSAFLMPL